jgi:hypothetical protein
VLRQLLLMDHAMLVDCGFFNNDWMSRLLLSTTSHVTKHASYL